MNSSTGTFQGLCLLFRNMFFKKHLSVGASGNKEKYNKLEKHKPNKNTKYKIQYKIFGRIPKNVSIMHLSENNLTSVIGNKD